MDLANTTATVLLWPTAGGPSDVLPGVRSARNCENLQGLCLDNVDFWARYFSVVSCALHMFCSILDLSPLDISSTLYPTPHLRQPKSLQVLPDVLCGGKIVLGWNHCLKGRSQLAWIRCQRMLKSVATKMSPCRMAPGIDCGRRAWEHRESQQRARKSKDATDLEAIRVHDLARCMYIIAFTEQIRCIYPVRTLPHEFLHFFRASLGHGKKC